MLEQERSFYQEKLEEWLFQFPNKFVLIKGQELIGTFSSSSEALAEGVRRFGLTSFLIRQVQDAQEEVNIPALTLGLLNASSTHSI